MKKKKSKSRTQLQQSLLADKEKFLIERPSGGDIRVALVYPNTYRAGMSSLGFHAVYSILNRMPGVSCERAFLDSPLSMAGMLETVETGKRVADCHIIAFSISYEHDMPNVLKILKLCGLPYRSADRESLFPLVIGGGAITFLNPEPLADFIDLFLLGEAENTLPGLIEAIKDSSGEKYGVLKNLANLPGVYVPAFYHPEYDGEERLINIRPDSDLPAVVKHSPPYTGETPASSAILASRTEFSNCFLTEVSRGCPNACRFCVLGWDYWPYRSFPFEKIRETLESALKHTRRLGLIAGDLGAYPGLEKLTEYLSKQDARISFSSFRAESINKNMAELLKISGDNTLTLAPEAGSENLRAKIGKNMTDEDLFNAVDTALSHGVKNLRLYFMAGLPGETDADIGAAIGLVKKIRLLQEKKAGSGSGLHVTVSGFVPKAGTPMLFFPVCPENILRDRLAGMKSGIEAVGGADISGESARQAHNQAALAKGDRRMGRVLEEIAGGIKSYTAAFRNSGIRQEFYTGSLIESKDMLPWEHLESNTPRSILEKVFKKINE
ncbi:MAG: radical SAM protein [Chloroflexi bacterium]|nr:radical SAM protein [Chloroflexota bacterium]